jgi:hypothetical protein
MSQVIDLEEVRLFIMDRAVEDNVIDLVANYFSDEEITGAMRRAAQHFNEIPPFISALSVIDNTLPYKLYLLNGVAYYLYLSKLQKLAKEDLKYTAGGLAVDLVGQRMGHFQAYLKLFKEEFIQGASADKIATNYNSAFGPVG